MFRSYGAVALGSTCSINISPLRGEEQSEHGIDDHLIRDSFSLCLLKRNVVAVEITD